MTETRRDLAQREQRDLDVIAAILAGERVELRGEAEEELRDLTLALVAERPAPSPELVAELEQRIEAGFGRGERRPARLGARLAMARLGVRLARLTARVPRRPLPYLAGAAAVLVVAAVSASVIGGGDGGQGASEPGAADRDGAPVQREAAPAGGSSAAPSVVAPEPPPGTPGDDVTPGARRRSVERSASLALEAPTGRLDRVAGRVARIATLHGGFVMSSDISRDGRDGSASFDLRIPAGELQPALAELGRAARVRSRSQSALDITAPTVSARDRLLTAKAERRRLLRRLARASSDREAEALRAQLDDVNRAIAGYRGQLRSLRQRAAYARVRVTVETSSDGGGGAAPSGRIGRALDDALGILAGTVALLVRALAVMLPLGLLGGLAYAAWRALLRRRRERALA